MDDKQRLSYVFVASLITMVMTVILGRIVTISRYHVFGYGRISYWITIIVVPALILLAAAIPGLFLLKYKKAAHYVSLGLAAPILAFCFSFTFLPLLRYAGWWAIDLVNFVFIAAAYFLADAVLNKWGSRFRYKVLVLAGIALFTILLDRVFAMFF
jgi:hypothetical protein